MRLQREVPLGSFWKASPCRCPIYSHRFEEPCLLREATNPWKTGDARAMGWGGVMRRWWFSVVVAGTLPARRRRVEFCVHGECGCAQRHLCALRKSVKIGSSAFWQRVYDCGSFLSQNLKLNPPESVLTFKNVSPREGALPFCFWGGFVPAAAQASLPSLTRDCPTPGLPLHPESLEPKLGTVFSLQNVAFPFQLQGSRPLVSAVSNFCIFFLCNPISAERCGPNTDFPLAFCNFISCVCKMFEFLGFEDVSWLRNTVWVKQEHYGASVFVPFRRENLKRWDGWI